LVPRLVVLTMRNLVRLLGPVAAAVALITSGIAAQPTGPSFSAATDLVVLHVTVKDKDGKHVAGLGQEAFTITEAGQPQTIRVYTSDDAPVTVGLMLDNSGSMQPNRERVISAAATFAETSNPLDEMFALTFDDEVRAVFPPDAPFTEDVQTLRNALTLALGARGRTALFDAMSAGFDYLARGRHERKVLVIVSDGGDNASRTSFTEAMARTQASNVVIYTVALVDPVERGNNPKILNQIARASGGEAFQPRKPNDIIDVLRQIARDIRHTYTIGYESSHPRDGTFRKVSVSVRAADGRRLAVQTRSGYLAGHAQEQERQ
jgi:Ca-activated chloride channel family protein